MPGDPPLAPLPTAEDQLGRGATALLFVFAFGVYAFTARLAFQIDDYGIIPASEAALRATLSLVTDPGLLFSKAAVPRPNPESPLFQPVCWALHALEVRADSTPLAPARFHILSALLHAVTATVLARFATRLSSRRAGLGAGLFFALHPAGAQAVTWIAARGLVLVTLFGLLAVDAARRGARTGRALPALLAGVLAGAALGCHVAAVSVALLALGTVFAGAGRPRMRHVVLAAIAAAPITVVAFVRARYLGGSDRYVGGVEASTEALPAFLAGVPSFVAHFLAPSSAAASVAPFLGVASRLGVGAIIAAVAFLGLALVAGSAPWTRGRRPALTALFAAGVLAIPGAFLWALFGTMADHRVGRVFYAIAAAVALLVAALLDAAARRGRARLAALPFAVLLLLGIDGLISAARLELAAAERIDQRARAIEDAARELPPSGTIVAVEQAVVHAGVPLVTTAHLFDLANPPFSAAPRNLQALDDLTGLLTPFGLLGRREAARVLIFNEAGVAKLRDPLPAAAGPPFPPFSQTSPAFPEFPEATTFAPSSPVAPRLVAAVRIRLRPGAGGASVDAVLRASHTQLLARATARAGDDAVVFGTASTRVVGDRLDRQAHFDWLLSPKLLDVTARGPLASDDPIELLEALPLLAASATLRDRSDARFTVPGAPPGALVLLTLEAAVGAARYHTVYRGAVRVDAGAASYVPSQADIVESDHVALRFDRLALHQDTVLARFGVRKLTLFWTLDLLNEDGATPCARSQRTALEISAGH